MDNEGPRVVPFAGTYLPDCAAFVHWNQSANKFLLPYPFSRRRIVQVAKKDLTSALGWKVVLPLSITNKPKRADQKGREKVKGKKGRTKERRKNKIANEERKTGEKERSLSWPMEFVKIAAAAWKRELKISCQYLRGAFAKKSPSGGDDDGLLASLREFNIGRPSSCEPKAEKPPRLVEGLLSRMRTDFFVPEVSRRRFSEGLDSPKGRTGLNHEGKLFPRDLCSSGYGTLLVFLFHFFPFYSWHEYFRAGLEQFFDIFTHDV